MQTERHRGAARERYTQRQIETDRYRKRPRDTERETERYRETYRDGDVGNS